MKNIFASFSKLIVAIFLICSFSTIANANVLGDMQTFAPNTDGLDFFTVHSSRPLQPKTFALGGHFSYARNHLVVFDNLTSQNRIHYPHHLIEFDFTFAYSFTERFAAFFSAPSLLYEKADDTSLYNIEITRGVHTYRPGVKYTFGQGDSEFAVIGSLDIVNLEDSPYTGLTSAAIPNIEIAKTFYSANRVNYGLNAGYRMRTPGARPPGAAMLPLDDQFIFSAGRSAPLSDKTRWILEGVFSTPINKGDYKDSIDASSADIILGLKHRIAKNLNLDWGGTFEPFIDTQSPTFRVFAGLVYYFSPFGDSQSKSTAPAKTEEPAPLAKTEPDPEALPDGPVEALEDPDSAVAGPLKVTPTNKEVLPGSVTRFKVSGGEEPYSLEVEDGDGTLNEEELWYRAPFDPETAHLVVRDAGGQEVRIVLVVKAPPQPERVLRLKNLNFITATANLVKDSQLEIDRMIRELRKRRVSKIIVEGHTDWVGSAEYNFRLSENRANTIKGILMRELDLNDDQVEALGFGEARPIADNKTAHGRLLNRRVDLKVYYRKK